MHLFHRVVLCAALALLPVLHAHAQVPPPAPHSEANLLLLEVRLGRSVLADAVTAYEIEREIFLPLGELSRLLTLAIRTTPAEGRASGYILSEERGFSLDVIEREVINAGVRERLDRSKVKLQHEDIYVSSRLLARWLPVDLLVDLPSLAVEVRPREMLPLQARRARGQRGAGAGARSGYQDPGYARHELPYRLAGLPFIDQTIGVAVTGGGARRRTETNYSAFLTSDLLGMQASVFATRGPREPSGHLRATLGRHDPDAGLLGPLHARSAQVGSVAVPGVQNISLTSSTGNGAAVSNRPLNQPSRFDKHTLQGDLAPGWDVELYYNEALVGFQQSGPDGKYNFPDMPLSYGPNDFRLVFHGPLGQLRVERYSFLLQQSAVAPGSLYYSASGHRDRDGRHRSLAQFDWGLASFVTATGALARLPVNGIDQRYAHLGLYGYWRSFILSGEAARAGDGGQLAQVGVKTRLGRLALSATRAELDGFTSEVFQPSADPVACRDELRIDGTVPAPGIALPMSLQARRDTLASGAEATQLLGRVSAYRNGMAVSKVLRWQKLAGRKYADGVLQASRRVAGIGLNGQLEYTISPHAGLGAVALSADYYLADGLVANLGLARSFANPHYRLSGALNKSLGSFGLGLNGFYTSRHEYGAGLQLFMALGIEPRQGRLLAEAQPMAGTGAASLRVFLDRNLNGVMDEGDQPVRNAGFTINGGKHMARTDANGLAYLPRLPSYQHLDIGFDTNTLEDPQWQPRVPGVRLVPRPGKVSELDFALAVTGEIDGTTFLLAGGVRRPVGDLELQLLGPGGKVAATMKTSSDGYYVIPAVFPGMYLLRVSPAQLERLGLSDTGMHLIEIAADGTLLNARDFIIVAGSQ
ncbi:carboxypeptidase-like regulatory domain-containing protein [Massilia sp. GCM10020059]|uniref:Carboxypeptidase-like regulatory domain-containing protein n=1 Tax=Massilia agrisoli TaxID=2892444 RepID=A0ABS8IX63_9BURK|nr:carboxypeptidase-like regulatory domain-containing protein [Massilia agrisoli]MCC6072268.1 carboxypeptidase-like regulatory domain-containing protein [Massilia agrisoli]